MENISDKKSPNGFLSRWELALGYLLTWATLVFAYVALKCGEGAVAGLSAVLAVTLQIFLIVFRKRPISINSKIGLQSGLDLRWNQKVAGNDKEVVFPES